MNPLVLKMVASGKTVRLGRIFRRETGRTVIAALDHGRRHGPLKGIENLRRTVETVVSAGVDAVMVTTGMIPHIADVVAGRVALIARIDGTGTIHGPDYTDDRLIASVSLASRMGADAVSVMIYMGSRNEAALLEKLGRVSEECYNLGIPLLAEAIPSPPLIKHPYSDESIAYCARIAAEYGADVVKTYYSGNLEGYTDVVASVPIPIVVLGGPRRSEAELLKMVEDAVKAGAKGVAIGRNIFQSRSPEGMARALVEVVHKRVHVEEALNRYITASSA